MAYMNTITEHELHRFFRAQEKKCPFCDGGFWGVMPVNQPIMMGAHTGHGAVCMNCGYVRVHVAEIVKIWLCDHPEEKAHG